MTDKIYFTCRELTGEFIAIKHGETTFNSTTIYDQDHCNVMNERQGITPAEAEAAMHCSMFDSWDNFTKIAERLASK